MSPPSAITVFIFDDDLHGRAHQYRLPQIDLHVYEHADDAVAHVQRQRPDIVLMDYSMRGEQSGAEAMTALHRLRQHRALPMRLVAISRSPDSNRHMLAAGADDAIPKTHIRGYLERCVERMLLADRSKRP